jgi:hypothetical protein
MWMNAFLSFRNEPDVIYDPRSLTLGEGLAIAETPTCRHADMPICRYAITAHARYADRRGSREKKTWDFNLSLNSYLSIKLFIQVRLDLLNLICVITKMWTAMKYRNMTIYSEIVRRSFYIIFTHNYHLISPSSIIWKPFNHSEKRLHLFVWYISFHHLHTKLFEGKSLL